jgi:uncharacterized 2Fe-2S/4Fe-4S cluster protein (DUF4445 family)
MPELIIHTPDADLRMPARRGDLLADLILAAGVIFDRPCAGRGECGKCKVKVHGELSGLTDAEKSHLSQEEIDHSLRLACQARILGDVEVTVRAGAVHTDKIFGAKVDARKLKGDLGLAIDLGSTTVGAFLVTLAECRVHAGYAVLNQQVSFGAEIISRLAAADAGQARELKSLAEKSIHEAVSGLKLGKAVKKRVRKAVVVGNTAMHHLALGLPVSQLIKIPFQPYTLEDLAGREGFLGDQFSENVPVRFAPVIGGFVGSDALACMLYFGFENESEPSAAVDLGTNGEIMLAHGDQIMVASTAAGPAFEGVNISCGMRALPGAVTSAHLDKEGRLKLDTIGGVQARGIAGSGLLSLARLFVKTGIIDRSGRILDTESKRHNRIELAPGVYISQGDIRELQKAKGAIRAAFDTLLKQENLKPEKLRRLILTGSFGGRVQVEDALALGIIPPVPEEIVHSIPNGAGMGAALMLDEENFDRAVTLAKKIKHVDLNADQEFMERYIRALELA